jgi:hypothetical protein
VVNVGLLRALPVQLTVIGPVTASLEIFHTLFKHDLLEPQLMQCRLHQKNMFLIIYKIYLNVNICDVFIDKQVLMDEVGLQSHRVTPGFGPLS